MAGFASVTHTHFCHICHCTRNGHGYDHLEQHLWHPRTNEETQAFAQAYRDCTTELESEAFVAQTGVRWSELLRLPYFDPTHFVVIDTMHNLFLGLINKHFQDILEMAQIRADIKSMVTPSWLTSVPSQLGSASHGKLKADQWRVLGSVYLPISLIRLWWLVQPENPRSERCRKILDVTIMLLSAVSIATS
ncbi:hypothetical protein GALMADRAFT_62004 [Galerina marginata CBS 339.88]|uniref:Uncharacterized protein n=1 Tax=Galerina marginata (strain CBS 339.88) TaxID=685588 RepID=A0A067TBM0_GALM3|nr:hypothetical protein GALMADRAFT_62004 [Galerina marginata CBS 339.88]